MSDVCDDADGLIQAHTDTAIASVSTRARLIPKGNPGECDLCGEYTVRLVEGACAPCRDRFKLP